MPSDEADQLRAGVPARADDAERLAHHADSAGSDCVDIDRIFERRRPLAAMRDAAFDIGEFADAVPVDLPSRLLVAAVRFGVVELVDQVVVPRAPEEARILGAHDLPCGAAKTFTLRIVCDRELVQIRQAVLVRQDQGGAIVLADVGLVEARALEVVAGKTPPETRFDQLAQQREVAAGGIGPLMHVDHDRRAGSACPNHPAAAAPWRALALPRHRYRWPSPGGETCRADHQSADHQAHARRSHGCAISASYSVERLMESMMPPAPSRSPPVPVRKMIL